MFSLVLVDNLEATDDVMIVSESKFNGVGAVRIVSYCLSVMTHFIFFSIDLILVFMLCSLSSLV